MSLTFDPAAHRYFWNGQPVLNVTRILEEVTDFDQVPREVLEIAKARGTAVHTACELDDYNDLDEASVDPIVVPYLAAYRKFKAECSPRWIAVEERVFHPIHQYAGTLDRFGEINGAQVMLDIKSGIEHPAVALQTSAYLEAYAPGGREKRMALYLRDDGDYRLNEVKTPHAADFRDFLCALGVYRWKQKYNLVS